MVKFSKLKKLKKFTVGVVVVKYSLWCGVLFLQGRAIEMAMDKNHLYRPIIALLLGYIFIKLTAMLADVLQKFVSEYYKNIELKQQWELYVPQAIYRDNQERKNTIHLLFFDYLPRLFEIEISIIMNYATMYYVFSLTILVFLYSGFFQALLALSLIFVLNYGSKNLFIKKIDEYQQKTNSYKMKLLNWLEQYFASFREISKNWPSTVISSWKNSIYESYFTAKKKQLVFYLYRDLLSQLLVELPFLLNTSLVIIGVYYDYLSLTQLFVWVGYSQFMIDASNAYLENRVNKEQLATLISLTNGILIDFVPAPCKEVISSRGAQASFAEITMRDGTVNSLSLKSGIYPILGGNGSGKTTLMNIILGYERQYEFANNQLAQLTTAVTKETTRVIEREAIIFASLNDLDSQIAGPVMVNWQLLIRKSSEQLLGTHLAKQWMNIFRALEKAYDSRQEKTMSSGEKVILSFMRFFFSWNREVNLLIIDECDAFLDQKKQRLFMETVKQLAHSMAVYITCHDNSFNEHLEKTMICYQPICT